MTIKQLFFVDDGFQALDLFGPLDAFMETNTFVPNAYTCQLLALNDTGASTSHGQRVLPDVILDGELVCDDLIICGGAGMRKLTLTTKQLIELRKVATNANRVISICTGAFLLADLFPDEEISMTSHWRHCASLSAQNPKKNICSEPLYVKSGNRWSSAGVLSGVDLALAIVKEDYGNAIAAKVAKELVVYVQRSGSQNQFSDMLQVQVAESLQLSPLLDWLNTRINKQTTVAQMAEYIGLSERQITRLFKKHLHATPSDYYRKMKLNYARDLLGEQNISVQQVAQKIGFNSYDSFRRAFYRQFLISPSTLSKGIH